MNSISARICRCGASRRRFGLALAVALLVAGSSAVAAKAQEAPLKIAVVDLEYIVANSPAGKALSSRLQAFTDEVQAEVKSKRDAANQIGEQIRQGANTLSDERLTKLQQDLEDAQIAIKRYQDDKQREGQKMQADGLREIEEQLKPVFEEITAERGYDLILNNVPGVIVMAGPRADITQAVIDKLSAATSGG